MVLITFSVKSELHMLKSVALMVLRGQMLTYLFLLTLAYAFMIGLSVFFHISSRALCSN